MKLILLALLELKDTSHFFIVLKKGMNKYSEVAILPEFRDTAHIGDLENTLYEALMNREMEKSIQAIDSLRLAYNTFGKRPTRTERGRFEMIQFLVELEETIMVAST